MERKWSGARKLLLEMKESGNVGAIKWWEEASESGKLRQFSRLVVEIRSKLGGDGAEREGLGPHRYVPRRR